MNVPEIQHGLVQLKDLGVFFLSAVCIWLGMAAVRIGSKPIFKVICKDGDKYVDKSASMLSMCAYRVVATAVGYSVLKRTGWLPWHLGGEGDWATAWTNINRDGQHAIIPRDVLVYEICTMGFYAQLLFNEIFLIERKNDFAESVLHHLATLLLFTGSMIAADVPPGCVIVFLHDIADIFVCACKVLAATNYSTITIPFAILLLLSWLWTRLLVFPMIVWSVWQTQAESMVFVVFRQVSAGFLATLFLLHVYWYCLIVKVIFNFGKTGAAVDTHGLKTAKVPGAPTKPHLN